jgi:flagellin-like protein
MRNKAQSQIITTILLILIVLAAVIVVWVIVNNFLKPIQEDAAVMCVEVKMNIVRANAADNTVTVTRLAGGEEADVSGMKFTVNDIGAAVTHVGGTECTECDLSLGLIESKTVTLGTSFNEGDKVVVAAQVGEQKRVCDQADSTTAVDLT